MIGVHMSSADMTLECSFCHKSGSTLISSPSDYPRAYICSECIQVCFSVLEDARDPLAASPGTPIVVGEVHPLLSHPQTSSLLTAVEQWIRRESLGGDAALEIAEVRRIALQLMKPSGM
jgi:hypothetical protein